MTLLMASLILLFLCFGLVPGNRRQAFLKGQIADKARDLRDNQTKANNLLTLANEVQRLQLRVEKFNKKLPKTAELGEFIRDLTPAGQQFMIRKLVHSVGTIKRQDLYGEIPVNMSFEGEFTNVFSFLRQLEEMPRLTRVKSLTVHCKDAKAGQVDVTMAMNIYFSEL
jgi:Tfp pilus assembly protein PilO